MYTEIQQALFEAHSHMMHEPFDWQGEDETQIVYPESKLKEVLIKYKDSLNIGDRFTQGKIFMLEEMIEFLDHKAKP